MSCSENPGKQLTVSCSVVTGGAPIPFGMLIFSKIFKISYPICARHKLKSWLASGLAERNLFWLGLGFLSIIFLMPVVLWIYFTVFEGLREEFGQFKLWCTILGISYWSIYLWAKANTPIKILTATDSKVSLLFANLDYADSFSKLNDAILTPPK